LEVFGPANARVGPHEDRPGRNAVGVRHHFAHAGAGVADRAPNTRALNDLAFVLRVGLVLGSLEIVETLPTRLRAAERLPVEFDVEPLGGEEALSMGDEIVKAHAFGSDGHRFQAVGHGVSSWNSSVICARRALPRAFLAHSKRRVTASRRHQAQTTHPCGATLIPAARSTTIIISDLRWRGASWHRAVPRFSWTSRCKAAAPMALSRGACWIACSRKRGCPSMGSPARRLAR